MDDTCILLSKRSPTQKTTFCIISFISFWKMQNYRKRKQINACQDLRESRVVDEMGTAQVYCLGGGIVLYSIVLVHLSASVRNHGSIHQKREIFTVCTYKKQPTRVSGDAGME